MPASGLPLLHGPRWSGPVSIAGVTCDHRRVACRHGIRDRDHEAQGSGHHQPGLERRPSRTLPRAADLGPNARRQKLIKKTASQADAVL